MSRWLRMIAASLRYVSISTVAVTPLRRARSALRKVSFVAKGFHRLVHRKVHLDHLAGDLDVLPACPGGHTGGDRADLPVRHPDGRPEGAEIGDGEEVVPGAHIVRGDDVETGEVPRDRRPDAGRRSGPTASWPGRGRAACGRRRSSAGKSPRPRRDAPPARRRCAPPRSQPAPARS
jgi:hypothetical protein